MPTKEVWSLKGKQRPCDEKVDDLIVFVTNTIADEKDDGVAEDKRPSGCWNAN